jgi:ABC-type transport system involved in cytochrome c biogenesis permease component
LPQSISLNLLLLLIPLSLSISALGTLLSLIAVVSSSRELLFSILFFPLSLPTVGSVLHLFQESILGNSIQIDSFPMMVLLVSGLIYTTLGAILFEEAI